MNDLEVLRDIFRDDRTHVGVGPITKLGLSQSGNVLRAQVMLLPDKREVVAEVTWDDIGRITFPQVNDLVMVAFVDGHPDEAHIMRMLSTDEDTISAFAQAGHTITNARAGKKNFIGSDTKVSIGRPDTEATEPAVLGQVLLDGLTALINCFLNAPQLGQCGVGPVVLDASVISLLQAFKQQYITLAASNVVSKVVFIDKGAT